eukprot:2202162-Pyramimonas_sp.AAC.1
MVTSPIPAHVSHVSSPQNELHRRQPWLGSYGGHPYSGRPLTRFVVAQGAPPKAPGAGFTR